MPLVYSPDPNDPYKHVQRLETMSNPKQLYIDQVQELNDQDFKKYGEKLRTLFELGLTDFDQNLKVLGLPGIEYTQAVHKLF